MVYSEDFIDACLYIYPNHVNLQKALRDGTSIVGTYLEELSGSGSGRVLIHLTPQQLFSWWRRLSSEQQSTNPDPECVGRSFGDSSRYDHSF